VSVKIKLIYGYEAAESSMLKMETVGSSETLVPSTKLYGVTILQDHSLNITFYFIHLGHLQDAEEIIV
jgi:hypothetical protein